MDLQNASLCFAFIILSQKFWAFPKLWYSVMPELLVGDTARLSWRQWKDQSRGRWMVVEGWKEEVFWVVCLPLGKNQVPSHPQLSPLVAACSWSSGALQNLILPWEWVFLLWLFCGHSTGHLSSGWWQWICWSPEDQGHLKIATPRDAEQGDQHCQRGNGIHCLIPDLG